jgi:hypothetical protein
MFAPVPVTLFNVLFASRKRRLKRKIVHESSSNAGNGTKELVFARVIRMGENSGDVIPGTQQ